MVPFQNPDGDTESLYDERKKNTSHIDGNSVVHPHSGHHAGMTGRGEGM